MRQSGITLYGGELGRRIGVTAPRSLLLKPDTASALAVTHLKGHLGRTLLTESVLPEKGFTIPVHLVQPQVAGWGTWIDGKFERTRAWEVGGVGIYDLESDPRVFRSGAFDVVHFNVPRATLNAFTEDAKLPAVTHLRCTEGARDAVLHHLSQMILPSLDASQPLPDLFLDHFVQMLCSRLVSTYSLTAQTPKLYRGGLAPWQKRRTLEVLEQRLDGDLRLSRLATECGLSSSYFSRCFRVTFGTSVHQFVIRKRVERAKELLLHSRSSMAEIAAEAGFSDQAAFSRTFGAMVGRPPAKWRAEHVAKRLAIHQHEIVGTELLMKLPPANARRAVGGTSAWAPL